MVGNLRNVARLTRRSRHRVDLSHPARSPLGSTVVNCEPTETEFAEAAELFGLHPLAVEDAVQAHQRPKLESYGDVLFAVLAVVPLGRPLETLSTKPLRAVDPAIRAHFRDVADHQARVTDQITAFDALIDSILQAHLAQVAVAQNDDARRITAWAAIIAVPTMVTGMYGMNLDHMPELRWRFGYPLASGVLAVACFFLYRGFKRNGWL
ncbi:CorA family divalent cation transporter [Streptomyces mirabilis]|uniref:CorA family divalent cation transporter n=1 Tax=Streptomyces mirabilis TaxID=68239 RepID=UPI0034396583